MVYLYDACDQISDFCHQQLLRKMQRKISWMDGQTDRGKTVYPPPPSGSGGIIHLMITNTRKHPGYHWYKFWKANKIHLSFCDWVEFQFLPTPITNYMYTVVEKDSLMGWKYSITTLQPQASNSSSSTFLKKKFYWFRKDNFWTIYSIKFGGSLVFKLTH